MIESLTGCCDRSRNKTVLVGSEKAKGAPVSMLIDFVWQEKHFILHNPLSTSRCFRVCLDIQHDVYHPSEVRCITIRQLHHPKGWGKPWVIFPHQVVAQELAALIGLLQLALCICPDIDSFFANPQAWLEHNLPSRELLTIPTNVQASIC